MKVLGGLCLENLVKDDEYLELQLTLFHEGFIDGVQIRVAHNSFTPSVTDQTSLDKLFGRLPSGFATFVHYGAENVGVDLGENLDECQVFQRSGFSSWREWNLQTLQWGQMVAKSAPVAVEQPTGVLHPGYGVDVNDVQSLQRITSGLRCFQDVPLGLETVPAVVDPNSLESDREDPPRFFWGFGSTPADMARLLEALNRPNTRCLLDLTHIAVTVNQAQIWPIHALDKCRDLETVLEDYLTLPRWSVCHYSGFPPTLVDDHSYMHVDPPQCIKDCLGQMEVVCLEISFSTERARADIERFRRFCHAE